MFTPPLRHEMSILRMSSLSPMLSTAPGWSSSLPSACVQKVYVALLPSQRASTAKMPSLCGSSARNVPLSCRWAVTVSDGMPVLPQASDGQQRRLTESGELSPKSSVTV